MRTETSKMKPNEPSRTALMIARQRAAHQVLDHGSILYDPFAMKKSGDGLDHMCFAYGVGASESPKCSTFLDGTSFLKRPSAPKWRWVVHGRYEQKSVYVFGSTVREAIFINLALQTLARRTSETGCRNRHLSIAQRSPDSERDFLWRHPPGGRRDRAENAPGLRWVR